MQTSHLLRLSGSGDDDVSRASCPVACVPAADVVQPTVRTQQSVIIPDQRTPLRFVVVHRGVRHEGHVAHTVDQALEGTDVVAVVLACRTQRIFAKAADLRRVVTCGMSDASLIIR